MFVRSVDEDRTARLNIDSVLCRAALGAVMRWQKCGNIV